MTMKKFTFNSKNEIPQMMFDVNVGDKLNLRNPTTEEVWVMADKYWTIDVTTQEIIGGFYAIKPLEKR